MTKFKSNLKDLIPIVEFNDDHEFSCGSRFRQFNIGLNAESINEDFYEYILCELPGERQHMLLICCEGYKSESPLAYVKTLDDQTKFKVSAMSIKFAMGIKDIYYIYYKSG